MFGKRSGLSPLIVTAVCLLASLGTTMPRLALAQQRPADSRQTYAFKIEAGPMGEALAAYSEISGVQLVYGSDLVKGVRTGGVSGTYSAAEALSRLLESSGLQARFTSAATATLIRVAEKGTRVLGPVRVEGAGGAVAVAGVNGSTDRTATEGTKSYTSSELTVGSKAPQSIKDTPQSVSVITQQQMLDQNLTDLTGVLRQTPGVSSVQNGNNLESVYYVRGFALDRFSIDGGAAMTMQSNNTGAIFLSNDMSMFDHVEILRGADGLFDGYGEPGGVINLVRKRPLDHSQVIIEGQVGSWDNHRGMLDATTPLGFDGRLRGRIVASWQNQDYFYDTASKDNRTAYGVLEMDLTPSTTLSGGADTSVVSAVPWFSGLPRYQNGNDLHLPRDICLCVPWSQYSLDSHEVFVRLDQAIGEDWTLKLNLAQSKQDRDYKVGSVSGTVNPVTLAGPRMSASMSRYGANQPTADVTLSGKFHVLGQLQELVVGGNFSRNDAAGFSSYPALIASAARPYINVFAFNPNAAGLGEPATPLPSLYTPIDITDQFGLYGNLRLTFWDRWHLATGLRWSGYTVRSRTDQYSTTTGNLTSQGSEDRITSHDFSWPPNYSLSFDVSKQVSVYASYADIYSPQTSYVDASLHPVGPITGTNIEAGVKWSGRDGRLNATLSVYRLVEQNFAIQVDYGNYASTFGDIGDGLHYCCYANESSSQDQEYSHGLDLELTGEILANWQASASYTYNDNEQRGSANYSVGTPLVSRAPKNLLKLWSTYTFPRGHLLRGLSVGGGVNAQTSSFYSGTACTDWNYGTDANGQPTTTCKPGANIPYNYTLGSYAIFSARIGYEFAQRWNIGLNLNNLADRRYYQTMGTSTGGNWYGDPRNFVLTVRTTF